MKAFALSAALGAALVISTVGAAELPPMDIMTAEDTPAAMVQRLQLPAQSSESARSRAEHGIERASPVAAGGEGSLGLGGGSDVGHELRGGNDRPEHTDKGKDDKEDKGDKDKGDKGHKGGG
jgi:hypothetical protein